MTALICWKVLESDGYYRSFIEKEKRPDGRTWLEARPITLKVGSINTAEGSSSVRLGNTSVICGVKAELAVPAIRVPDKGVIVPNVELYPCCSPLIKAGPPGEKAMVASKFLSGVIRSSGLIDLESLCIIPNKVVWCLYCDIVCLDYDGNLLDAALLALVAALKNVQLPVVNYDVETEEISVALENTEKLNLMATPTSTTFTIYDSSVHLIDPSAEDEANGNGEVTIVLKDENTLCSSHKSGGQVLPSSTLQNFIITAKERAKVLTNLLQKENKKKKKKKTL